MKHVERTNCIYKKNNPGIENSLKTRISDIVHSISPAKLRCVMHSMLVSCDASLRGEGDKFPEPPLNTARNSLTETVYRKFKIAR
jgi:hypothetical protein